MSWTTRDEINFLSGLGTGTFVSSRLPPSQETPNQYRLRLLKEYRKSMEMRVFWNGLNRREIEVEVDRQISQLSSSNKENK